MKRGVFVTGTDTNIGKTVLSAALLHRYRPLTALRYWKPVQTGSPADDDTATVQDLAACTKDEICGAGIRLPRSVSPHLAAELSGSRIDLESIPAFAGEDEQRAWIVEGAGGVLVPLNERRLIIDLIENLRLPCVIMARSDLGTINHTLLTLEALRARSIRVAGVVLGGEFNRENRRAIETYGCVPVVGEMPRFPELNSAALGAWAKTDLDPDSTLAPLFMEGSR